MNANSSPQPRRSQANRHTRRWLPYLGLVLLGAILVLGFWPKPVPVETDRVSVGPLRATVSEEGKTRLKHRFVVSAPVAGSLRRIDFKAGAEVEAGTTLLAVIDPQPPAPLDARNRSVIEARRAAALANSERARVNHQFAASELRRLTALHDQKTISEQEFESAQMREAASAREVTSAEGEVRQMEALLADFGEEGATNRARLPKEVKAPVSGKVLRVLEESARIVSAGTALLELGDPADLEVVIEVLSRDGAAILPGASVELDQWGGSAPLKGRVRLVEPSAFTKVSALGVEEQRVNVVADLLDPPAQRTALGDHFRVEARIVIWEESRAVKVPAGALFRRGGQWASFVAAEGRARLRAVKIGRSSGTEIQVLDGLKEGEEVILYPGDRVRDGLRIRSLKLQDTP